MVTLCKFYEEPPVCEREILRYAGCKTPADDVTALLRETLAEVRGQLSYGVVYGECPVTIAGDTVDLGAFSWQSSRLAAHLAGCDRAVLFAATIGVAIDRLIAKYNRLSPSKAVMLQAIGAERIEALCDAMCKDLAQSGRGYPRSRFSPGYGDLPLTAQHDVFAVLDCQKRLGMTLNDSLLISPSKSVTAIVGFSERETACRPHTCSACDKRDCAFRGVL